MIKVADYLKKYVDIRHFNADSFTVDLNKTRIEGRTRNNDITEALRLRVHDPLWMLTRQWQMGEFRGNNAGTAMSVRCIIKEEDCSIDPIEPVTEQMNPEIDLFARIEAATFALDLYREDHDFVETKAFRDECRTLYGIDQKYLYSSNKTVLSSNDILEYEYLLNTNKADFIKGYVNKSFDGSKLYEALTTGKTIRGFEPYRDKFINWFRDKYKPTSKSNDHWLDEDLCYEVEAFAGEKHFKGDRYQGGRLSWYSFDYDKDYKRDDNITIKNDAETRVPDKVIKLKNSLYDKPNEEYVLNAGHNAVTLNLGLKPKRNSQQTILIPGSKPSMEQDIENLINDIIDFSVKNGIDIKDVINSIEGKNLKGSMEFNTIRKFIIDLSERRKISYEDILKIVKNTLLEKVQNNGDIKDKNEVLISERHVLALPTPATFAAAPNKRLWQMEDRKVYMGNSLSQQSEANVVVMKYAAMYSNDWMLFPLETEIGKFITVEKIEVIDTFGGKTVISGNERAGKLEYDQGSMGLRNEAWQMFTNTNFGNRRVTDIQGLYFVPQLAATVEGKPIEEVKILRDEMANMVWGVEEVVPDGCGETLDAKFYATHLQAYVNKVNEKGLPKRKPQIVQFADGMDAQILLPENDAQVANYRYMLQSQVPYNWIPFIPQRITNGQSMNNPFFLGGREMILRRGKMPCYLYNEKTNDFDILPVRPLGTILRPEIIFENGINKELPMVIHEEAVQATGIRLTKNYQRARWLNGRTYNWLGLYKRQSHTEAGSSLIFDELKPNE